MSYGIEVFNSTGKTVFDSNHYVEIGAHTGTVNSTETFTSAFGENKFMLPDWLFGYDQLVELTGINHAIVTSGVAFNNAFEIRVKLEDTNGQLRTFQIGSRLTGTTNPAYIVSVGSTQGAVSAGPPTYAVDFSNAYQVLTMTRDMTAIRGSTTARTNYPYEVGEVRPTVWARPTGSFTGRFSGGGLYRITDPTHADFDHSSRLNAYTYIATSGSTATQFELMVTLPAYAWGGVSGTKAHTSGTGGYGVSASTDATKKHTPSGSTVAFITYDNRGRPAKGLLTTTEDYPSGSANNYTVQNVSMGTLTTSNTKRWCRLDGTSLNRVDTRNYPTYNYWSWAYDWQGNSNISLDFTNTCYSGANAFVNGTLFRGVFDTLESELFLAVGEFGLGL